MAEVVNYCSRPYQTKAGPKITNFWMLVNAIKTKIRCFTKMKRERALLLERKLSFKTPNKIPDNYDGSKDVLRQQHFCIVM